MRTPKLVLPLAVTAIALLLPALPTLSAAPPAIIQYQGVALDPQGSPLQTPIDVAFAIFDDALSGSALWQESHLAVPVSDGVFSVPMGSIQPLQPVLFLGGDLWLEVEIDGEKLTPRQRISSVAWAMQAGCAPGDILHCYSGSTSTLEIGRCRPGNRVCDADGRWGACTGEILPAAEICQNGLDEDCDGVIDNGCPVCGDGVPTGGEGCDDGNTLGGDGCCATCEFEGAQTAPPDANFNNPLDIPLDNTASVVDFVSFPDGDTQDRVRYQVTGMNPNPVLPGGQARLLISVSCFGTGTSEVEVLSGGQTYGCGQTVVDRNVTADTDTGTVTITAVGGTGTYVQWVLTGTATRLN